MVLAATYGTGEVLLSMLYFFLFIIWLWLLIMVFADIFRSHDMSGWGKAGWSILVIVLPFIGIFAYLIARGDKMALHEQQDQDAANAYFDAKARAAVLTGDSSSPAGQLSTLNTLHDRGVINDEEYARMKASLVA